MATTNPTHKNASSIAHAGVTEHIGHTRRGEPYRYFRCETCHAEWTADTPGEGCGC
jgi:hypothetical protein